MVRDLDSDWPLTYSNLVSTAACYAIAHDLKGDLKETVQHMMENTKFKPCFHMVKNGVSQYYHRKYEVYVKELRETSKNT